MVGGRQHGGFEWASRALSLRWFISDSAQIMEYQGACTEALLVYAHIERKGMTTAYYLIGEPVLTTDSN